MCNLYEQLPVSYAASAAEEGADVSRAINAAARRERDADKLENHITERSLLSYYSLKAIDIELSSVMLLLLPAILKSSYQ